MPPDLHQQAICAVCDHNHVHGWWGVPNATHCRICHLSWKIGTRQSHCVRCCAHFSSPTGFEQHFRDDSCLDPETTLDAAGRRLFVRSKMDGGAWSYLQPGKRETTLSEDSSRGVAA